ncbi:MAG TPA: D-alanyl-D-alanine carboxypeptidase family protein [Candidatus Paceibacterota bacterium]|nr:D-alanyl-D-alanine carboxypeptidase family protein [Candidatus Paceibacterota bacterium]
MRVLTRLCFGIGLALMCLPLFAYADCKTVVWGSSDYNSLVSQGWGPSVDFFNSPPAGTTVQICSDWKSSTPASSPSTPQSNTCPNPGERPAVASDPVVQNGTLAVGTCYNPNTVGISQQYEQAKQDLASMRCSSSVNTEQLDPKFATCADTFMRQLRQVSPAACIDSAYRSEQQQLAACMGICGRSSCPGLCAPPGESYHQKGLAIDVSKVQISNQQFWSLALQSGIGNPTGLHSSDPHHVQAMNGGSSCATLGYQPTNTDTFVPGPQSNNPYFNYGTNPLPSVSPSLLSPLTNPAQTTPIQSTPTVSAQQCAPQFSCVQNTIYLQTTSCTQQVYQTCQYGCSGTVCLPNPTASTTSPILGTTYPIIVPSTTPALTMLQQFTNPLVVATATAPASAPTLTAGIYNVISADASATPNSASTYNPSGTLPAQQTFVSSDISSGSYTQAPSGLVALLQNLQSVLTHLFSYLVSIGK